MAVVFGERPDLRISQSESGERYDRHGGGRTEMKNHFEGATPEALAIALLKPICEPKAKPARSPERVVRTSPAETEPAAK